MVAFSNVIKAIIVVAVIVIVIAILWIFFRQVYPWLRGEPLSAEAEQNAANNFDALIGNIKKCQSFASSNCICEGLPQFPAAFPHNSILNISHSEGKVKIEIAYGKKVTKNATIENLKLSAIYLNKKKVAFYNEKRLDFKREPPYYEQENIGGPGRLGSKIVLSPYLYKEGDTLYFFIGTTREYEKETAEKNIEKLKKCS